MLHVACRYPSFFISTVLYFYVHLQFFIYLSVSTSYLTCWARRRVFALHLCTKSLLFLYWGLSLLSIGFSVANAIGTQLRCLMNSALARWCTTFLPPVYRAHGFSVANVIDTQLRCLMNSALARWCMTVLMEPIAESGEGEWSPVSKHQIQPGCGDWAGWRGTGQANIARETKLSGANGDRENSIFHVQLTTSRISNHTRLMPNLLKVTSRISNHTHTHSIELSRYLKKWWRRTDDCQPVFTSSPLSDSINI